MGYRILTQLGMIGASLFIVFGVISPKLEDIKVVEDQTAQYKQAADNGQAYNDQLSQLVAQKGRITQTQMEALERYMPDRIDSLQVMSDVENMTQLAGLQVVGISLSEEDIVPVNEGNEFQFDEDGEPIEAQPGSVLTPTDFTLSAEGSYAGIKQLLSNIEFNDYRLEVIAMNFAEKPLESAEDVVVVSTEPVLDISLTLRAYSLGGE